MGDAAGSLAEVARQLEGLAADPENQPIIAREEGCLSALISFIAAQDPDVAPIALSAMNMLASHPENTDLLFAEIELVDALKDASGAPHLTEKATADALECLRQLTPETAPESLMELDLIERRLQRRRVRRAEFIQAGGDPDDVDFDHETNSDGSRSPDRFRIPVPQKGRDDDISRAIAAVIYELIEPQPQLARVHVPGISDEDKRHHLETYLIGTKGFLSVSFEIGAEIAVILSRIPDDHLMQLVAIIHPGHLAAQLLSPDDPDPKPDAADQEREQDEEAESGYVDLDAKMRYKHFVQEQQQRTTLAHGGGTSLAAKLEEQRRAAQRQKARTGRLLDRFGKGWNLW